MKAKKICVIICYFIICYFVNVKPYINIHDIEDISNLLFLNILSFEQYNLEPFNIPYILTYSLLFYIITYFDFSSTNEYISYIQMISYRMSKRRFYIKQFIISIFKNIQTFLLLFLCVLLISLFEWDCQIDLISILKITVFLLRFINIFVICNIIYDVGSFIGKSTIYHYIAQFFSIILLLLDIVAGSNFITYSNDLGIEYILLLTSFITCVVISILGWIIFKRRGDIL